MNATRLLDKSEVLETHRYVAGLLHAFCCLSRKFAIWGVSLKPGLCSDSQVQAYPGSPSSVLGKKWRTFLDACLMCNQLLMLIRWLQHSPGGALEEQRESAASVHRGHLAASCNSEELKSSPGLHTEPEGQRVQVRLQEHVRPLYVLLVPGC